MGYVYEMVTKVHYVCMSLTCMSVLPETKLHLAFPGFCLLRYAFNKITEEFSGLFNNSKVSDCQNA